MRRLTLLLACLVVTVAEPATARGAVRVTEGIVYERLLRFARAALR